MTQPARLWRITRALFARSFAVMTEYRAEIAIWMISGSLPLIMMFIWISLAEAGPVGGYSAADFAAYFLTVFFVRQMTVVWVLWELDRQIRLGELSPKLLRPLDPFWEHAMDNLAEKVVRIPLLIPPLALGFWLTGARLELALTSVLAFMLALSAAWVMRFCQQYSFGLLTFWFDQVLGLEQVWFALYFGLSGMLAPLSLYPEAIQRIIAYTPFPYLVDFPVQVLLGNVSGSAFWQGLAIQALWVAVFVTLRWLLWRQGLRRYGAVGA